VAMVVVVLVLLDDDTQQQLLHEHADEVAVDVPKLDEQLDEHRVKDEQQDDEEDIL